MKKISLTSGKSGSYGKWTRLKFTRQWNDLYAVGIFNSSGDSSVYEIDFGIGRNDIVKVMTSVDFCSLNTGELVEIRCLCIPPKSIVYARIRKTGGKATIKIEPKFHVLNRCLD